MRRALALLLLVLPLAACGGSDVTSLDPVAQAADKTTNVGGAHFQLSGQIRAAGQTVAFSGPGEIGDHGRALHMRLSLPAAVLGMKGSAGGNATFEIVSSEGSFYVRGGAFDTFTHGKWIRVNSDDATFNLGQNDPSKLLEYLRGVSNVRERGNETVRGVDTTHYAAQIQIDKVASKLQPDAARALEQLARTLGTRQIPLDVWVDGDGLVRRVRMDWHPNVGALKLSFELFDFGDVHVKVPAAAETTTFGLGG
jgi:hypothetical protein